MARNRDAHRNINQAWTKTTEQFLSYSRNTRDRLWDKDIPPSEPVFARAWVNLCLRDVFVREVFTDYKSVEVLCVNVNY